MEQAKPIEVVHVIPNEFTVNQVASVFITLGLNTFLTPLVLRALLRNFGIDLPYWKAVRTYYAIRLVAHATLPGGYQYPAAKGKLWTDRFKAYLDNQRTPAERAAALIRERHEERQRQEEAK